MATTVAFALSDIPRAHRPVSPIGTASRIEQLASEGYSGQQTDQPIDPHRPDNLDHDVPGDCGAHGLFDDRSAATASSSGRHPPGRPARGRRRRGPRSEAARPPALNASAASAPSPATEAALCRHPCEQARPLPLGCPDGRRRRSPRGRAAKVERQHRRGGRRWLPPRAGADGRRRPQTPEISTRKAWTAAMVRLRTKAVEEMAKERRDCSGCPGSCACRVGFHPGRG